MPESTVVPESTASSPRSALAARLTVVRALRLLGWQTRDAVAQAYTGGLTALVLAAVLVAVVLCLSIRLTGPLDLKADPDVKDFVSRMHPERDEAAAEGVPRVEGELSVGWGAVRVPLFRDGRSAVHFIQLLLGGAAADTAGLLLALAWTAGFLPGFLAPNVVSVMLAKPVPRPLLLFGKYFGVVGLVAVYTLLFVGGTWIALGASTNVWSTAYLYAVPLLVFQFAVFFSFSTLVAVVSRSTVVCVFGTGLFFMLCWSVNLSYLGATAQAAMHEERRVAVESKTAESKTEKAATSEAKTPSIESAPPPPSLPTTVAYWILPKPADLAVMYFDAVDAGRHFGFGVTGGVRPERPLFNPWLTIVTSAAAALALLLLAGRLFSRVDY
ncbi:MAG: ABC transporter permease [Planctomycetia bacterium]